MTVIRPNSVSGINSITAQANEIKIFKSDGTQGGLVIGGANLNATSGISTVAALTVTGNVSVGGTLTYQDVTNIDSVGVITARAGVKVPDSQTVFLGTDDDLQIYHDGSHSYVKNATGNLYFQHGNENMLQLTSDGNVELYYDNSKKFETTSAGVTVTNDLVCDGTGDKAIRWSTSGTNKWSLYHNNSAGALVAYDNANNAERLRITSGGSVGFNTTLTQSSKTVHIAGDYRSVTQNVADEGLIFQSFATASTGDVYPGISWTGNPGALGRARAAITAIATNNNNGSDLVFLTRNQADGTELDVTDDEKVRITSGGRLGIGADSPTSLIHGQVSSGSAIATLESTATSGEASVSLKGKNSSGTVRTGIFKYDNADMFRIGTTAGIPIRFETDDTERFRIAGDGQATFDKGAPGGANQVIARFQAESSRRLDVVWHDSGSLMGFDTPSTHSYIFKCGGAEKFRITPDGRCGFNDSTGGWAETLQVTSRASNGQYCLALKIQNNSGYFMRFANGTNAPCGSVSSSGGNSTSYNTSWSDSRRKKNFETWNEEVLPLFKTLEPKKFNFTHEDDGSEKTKGYVAQDVVNKFPEAYPLLDDTDVGEKRYMFNPSGMTVYLMKALQEEIAKREALEARITALEGS